MQHAGAVQVLRADVHFQHGIAFAPFHQPVAHQRLVAGGRLQGDKLAHQRIVMLRRSGEGGGFRHICLARLPE